MTRRPPHPHRPVCAGLRVAVIAALLAHGSVSGGCLRKWMAKREAAREAARLAELETARASANPDGIGPSESGPVAEGTPDISGGFRGPSGGVIGLTDAGEPGLEVAVWTCDDTAFGAARVLARYAGRPVPIPEPQRRAWRERGLRFVAVPMEDLDTLARSTRPMSPVQRQRFGQLVSWAPIVRGPEIRNGAAGPGGAIQAGKPRLIARAWIEPDLSSGEVRRVVRVEAGVQIETGRRPNLLRDSETLGTVSDDGVLVEGLLVSFPCDGRDAIVLVGESPGVDWAALPGLSGGGDAGGTGGTIAGATGVGGAIGPSESAGLSIGERMLAAEASPSRNGRPGMPPRKVLVVLIPRVEARAGAGVNDALPGSPE